MGKWNLRQILRHERKKRQKFRLEQKRLTVYHFTDNMLYEIEANSHKTEWQPGRAYNDYHHKHFILELAYHQQKLTHAVLEGNLVRVAELSADVANCAMILADSCGALKPEVTAARRAEGFFPQRDPIQAYMLLHYGVKMDEQGWVKGGNSPLY